MTSPTTRPARVPAIPRHRRVRTRLLLAVVSTAVVTVPAARARSQAPSAATARADTTVADRSMNASTPAAPSSADSGRAGQRVTPPSMIARHLDASVALRGGTLGAGVEIGKLLTDHLALRAGYFHTPLTLDRTISGVRYAARVQLQGGSLLADLFPSSRGRFHVTAGAIVNGPRVNGSALPGADGTVTLNRTAYTQAQFGTLTGTLSVPRVAPYFGLGFGTPARKSAVSLVGDFGVMIGAPKLTLNATGAAGNPALQSDLAAQQATTQRQINRYGRVVPVTSVGLAVRF